MRGLTQTQLGRLVHKTGQEISRWEKGERPITLQMTEKIAAALGCPLFEILDTNGARRDTPPLTEIPILSVEDAIGWVGNVADNKSKVAIGWAFVPAEQTTLFALTVPDGAVNRFAPEGAMVISDYAQTALVDGATYVIVDEDRRVLIRRYWSEPERFAPDSTEAFDTIYDVSGFRPVARVIRITSEPPV